MKTRLIKSAATVLVTVAVLWLGLRLTPRPPLHEGIDYSNAWYDRNGTLLRLDLTDDDKYRLWVPLADISDQMIEAVLLQEDRYFYQHAGVNPVALIRAFWKTYVGGDSTMGASTITMQLARLRYRLHTRSIAGKLRQIFRAFQLEIHYSKDQILESYLNLAPYGGNIEGVGAAAAIYFSREAGELSLGQALLLAVVPQRPGARSPNAETGADMQPWINARELLLGRWLELHPDDAGLAGEVRTVTRLGRPADLPFLAPHLVNHLQGIGFGGGVQRTTLDLPLQLSLERTINRYVKRKSKLGIRNATAMLLDFRDMSVVSLVGSADFWDESIFGQVDGTQGMRSPGSTLKPFIYGLAIDQGLVHPETMLKDAPLSFGLYNPENFDGKFEGPVSVRLALIKSRNLPAIMMAAKLKDPTLYEFLRRVDIGPLKQEEWYGLALALGGAEVRMVDLVRMYAMLAGEGKLRPLRYLVDQPRDEGQPLLSREASWMVLDMLHDNPRPDFGFGRDWVAGSLPVAWKTGTSYSYRDAWTIGVFGPYVLAVWIGDFAGRPNPAYVGLKAAAPLFFEIIDAVRAMKSALPPVPAGGLPAITSVSVCSVSGMIPGPYCPHTKETHFIPGRSPIHPCTIHRQIAIDQDTGLRACPAIAAHRIKQEVYEFWPTDLAAVFHRAGIPRRSPPEFHPSCRFDRRSHQGQPPRITSPRFGLVYQLRLADEDQRDEVPFAVVGDGDAGDIHWFVDNRYLGTAPAGRPFLWHPEPGLFTVTALDTHGRSDSRNFTVELVR